jgi:hypothetical protein
MVRTNRLVRGCIVLVLAVCIITGAGAIFALDRFRQARAAGDSSHVINIGPLYIGSPCAQLQASYPAFRCNIVYYVVVKVNETQLWSMQLP